MKRPIWGDWNAYLETRPSSPPSDDIVSFRSRAAAGDVALEPSLAHQPDGVLSVAVAAGVKHEGVLDLAVVKLVRPGAAAAVFTRNLCASEAVVHGRRTLADGRAQLLAVVSKNANVFTPHAAEDIATLARWLATEFAVREDDVVVSCTGGIGIPLPMTKLERAIAGLSTKLHAVALDEVSRAILTTDRVPKVCSVRVGEVVVCAMAKGAGMIEPDMATMLVYVFTNADLDADHLRRSIVAAADRTFNSISVDSDTSTSDTVAIFSTRAAAMDADLEADFDDAVRCVFAKLARDVVSQSEGATKLIECTVRVDTSPGDARIIAKKIINSPLLKAAVHGGDPNWGRIVMAIGKPDDRTAIRALEPSQVRIEMMGQRVFSRSEPIATDLDALSCAIKASTRVPIDVWIGEGHYVAKVWGCDLSARYVEINAEYMT